MDELLEEATSEYTASSNYSYVRKFAQHVKNRRSSYPLALSMIVFKIRSWDPVVGMLAINVIEECMEVCGPLFVAEVSKNTFLNELVKIIHPRYDGNSCPSDVRLKLIRVLESWKKRYSQYSKFNMVFNSLIESGVITETDRVPPKIERELSIGDASSNFKLSRLVREPTWENIERANTIIRKMVKEACFLLTLGRVQTR